MEGQFESIGQQRLQNALEPIFSETGVVVRSCFHVKEAITARPCRNANDDLVNQRPWDLHSILVERLIRRRNETRQRVPDKNTPAVCGFAISGSA
jgi:hypothetical protein